MLGERQSSKESDSTRVESITRADDEDEALRKLGIRRELRKEFTSFSNFSFALGVLGFAYLIPFRISPSYQIISCAATIASTVNTPMLLGGPASVIWAWFLGCFGCIAIASSVAGTYLTSLSRQESLLLFSLEY